MRLKYGAKGSIGEVVVTLRIESMAALLRGRQEPADFEFTDGTSAYAGIRRPLVRFEGHALQKPEMGLGRRSSRRRRPSPNHRWILSSPSTAGPQTPRNHESQALLPSPSGSGTLPTPPPLLAEVDPVIRA